MPEENDKLTFEASAYLQTLIGRELFRSRELAVVELVKNAYDSGAHHVTIQLSLPTTKRPASLEITDDGRGMDVAEIKRLFMVAGYSEKNSKTGPQDRIATGEKGIGRFASDRLGSTLQVETKVAGDPEGTVIPINWNLFNTRTKRFNQITVPYYRRRIPFLKTEQSGTRFTITNWREPWNQTSIEELRRVLAQLFNPFDPPKDFTVNLQVVGSDALSGSIKTTPIQKPDFDLRFTINDNGDLERTLKHAPTIAKEKKSTAITGAKKLAGLQGRIYYYVNKPRTDQTHKYPPGVFLFRDGFRIEPFGSTKADWLGIGEKRAKRAGHAHIVPSRLFGFVAISRKEHAGLRDTTSREALLDTEEARALVHVLTREIMDFLEEEILHGVAEPRWEESKKSKAAALQRVRFQALSAMSSGVAHELRQPLQAMRSEAGNITKRLKQLKIEDDIINRAQKSIDLSIERIDQRIQLISALTGKKLDEPTKIDLAKVIREECDQYTERCKQHEITVEFDLPASHESVVSDALVRMIIKNMLDNAINALSDVTDGRQRRIHIGLQHDEDDHIVSVRDNGMGIPPEIQEKLLKGFSTNTTGGMGVGLYICNLLIKSHDGEIVFVSSEETGTVFSARFAEQEITNAQ